MEKGRFTLPGETGMEEEIKKLVELWGVDAIRDSDGTQLSQELIDMGLQVYSTICLVRLDNEYAKANQDKLQQIFLTSERYTAMGGELDIPIMEKLFDQQFKPNTDADIRKYWQVMDRTTGETHTDWGYKDGIVTVHQAKQYHEYSVDFLAYQLWEPVSMYNHLTNDWKEEHRMPIDVRYPEVQEHILKVFEQWLKDHPKTDVVRFTTFFYCFDLMYNQYGKERAVNWFGYMATVSPLALEQFAKEYGYEMTPEDFIDNGRYNTPFKNPTKKYRDWMEFNMKFVSGFAKKCVDLAHQYGKKAIMFLGDHWAGTEPYGPYFESIGLDAVVGAAGDGVTTRMIADIPVKETEARFYPYFFPDVFYEGGDPVGESAPIWIKCRRAIMRKPMARMGYGGYLSLALKFPEFVEHVTMIAEQFKEIARYSEGKSPRTAFKVGILNSWGKIRSWQTHQVAHSLWNQRCYSYLGVLEALAGMEFEVEFLSFDDIRGKGIDKEIKVLINAGDAYTAWSGGENWADAKIAEEVRKFVAEGGGFIGVGEPTAYEKEGQLFTLADMLGVQKEIGFTASNNKPEVKKEEHYITKDCGIDSYGEGMSMIYRYSDGAKVLDIQDRSCTLAANEYGKGRSVYMAGLPYSNANARVLQRAVYWAAGREEELEECYCSNPATECAVYPQSGRMCVVNNSLEEQETEVHCDKNVCRLTLKPLECVWM